MSREIYGKLQQHFDSFPLGFPPTESGVEIRLLKRLFSPQEAEIALFLKCGHFGSYTNFMSLNEIHSHVKDLGYSLKDLERHLDNMVKNGAIMGAIVNGIKSYANALLILGIYELQVNKLSKGFLEDFEQYLEEGWGPANRDIDIPQMRVIPVGIEVDYRNEILGYDNITNLFQESEGPFLITNCVCRQTQDLLGNPCKMTDRREVCMAFGDLAKMYIEQGWGREISKLEALEYLRQNEEEGLIFRPGNTQKMDFVCSCCYCCCGTIANLKNLPNPANFTTSNYYALIDEGLCSGCGLCEDRCQMEAISLENDIFAVNLERCIGCGNCVVICPSEAINLHIKKQQNIPPLTVEVLHQKLLDKRKEIKNM